MTVKELVGQCQVVSTYNVVHESWVILRVTSLTLIDILDHLPAPKNYEIRKAVLEGFVKPGPVGTHDFIVI
jgi:hypothetical protein